MELGGSICLCKKNRVGREPEKLGRSSSAPWGISTGRILGSPSVALDLPSHLCCAEHCMGMKGRLLLEAPERCRADPVGNLVMACLIIITPHLCSIPQMFKLP